MARREGLGAEESPAEAVERADDEPREPAEDGRDGLALGGHEDWRLPSLHELLSIVDPTRGGPTIDSRGFPSTPSAYYWTRTPYAPVSGLGWTVSFSAGTSFPQNESVAARVRCVR